MPSMMLGVDTTRFLTHLPQFFRSLSSGLSETLQNAYRAHATRVDITLTRTPQDDAWVLAIQDDGPGAPDPADLFTAARTGWDESQVIEPAGMGLFALLGLAERVTITSRLPDGSGWTATVLDTAFAGDAFDIVPLDPTDNPSAFTLVAVLKPEADIRPLLRRHSWEDTPAWRHAYPLTVTIHRPGVEGSVDTEVLPSRLESVIATWQVLTTDVGTLYGNRDRLNQGRHLTVVWEHRLIYANRLDLSLALTTRYGALGEQIAHALPRDLVWILPQDTTIRPQLPERSAIIANTAWHDAVNALADALVQAFDVEPVLSAVLARALTLPDVTVDSHIGSPATQTLPLTGHIVSILAEVGGVHPFFAPRDDDWMTWAGYRSLTLPDPFDVTGDWEGENADGYDGASQALWMKDVPWTADRALADALNWQGFWTLVGESPPGTSTLSVALHDLAWIPGDPTWFPGDDVEKWLTLGRASVIEVLRDGAVIGMLPWLASPEDTDFCGDGSRLIMADRDQSLGYDTDAPLPLPYLIYGSEKTSFWDYVYGGELDLSDLTDAVIRVARETWDVVAAERQVAIDRARVRQGSLSTLVSEAQNVLPLLADDPVLSNLLTQLVERITAA